jgi:rhodanese-related sulfurtransferase
VAGNAVGGLWRAIREVAGAHVHRIDELTAAYLGDRSQLATIGREDLLARMRAGEVVVLDVRPPAEYAAGHLPDAVNIPPDELETRLADLPADQAVVAYCRGPLCAYADTAVRTLTERGRTALRLVDGLPEWAAAGLPVVGASA